MKYYYFPTTTFARKGMGYGGTAYGSNGGFLVGCGKGGNFKEVTEVTPGKIAGKTNFVEQAALAKSESKGGPTQITKKRYDLWKWLGEGKTRAVDWFRDKYNRFKASRFNQWRLKKQEAVKGWVKAKYNQLMNTPQMKALCSYITGTKIFAKASVKTAWNLIKEKMTKLGINIYAYGRATAEVLKDSIQDGIKMGKDFAKNLAEGGFNVTKELILTLGQVLKILGWSPLQIAIALCVVQSDCPLKDKLTYTGMDGMLKMVGKGTFNMGAGMKRRRKGRFVKGSPEAKAYMRHLRSMRRR